MFPLPRREPGPLLESELAPGSWCAAHGDQGCLDGDGSGSAERIAEGLVAAKSCRQQECGRQRLPERRLGLRAAPAALVEQNATRVCAHGANVMFEPGKKQLGVLRGLVAFRLRERDREADARLEPRMQALGHTARVIEPRFAASDPERHAGSLADEPLPGK